MSARARKALAAGAALGLVAMTATYLTEPWEGTVNTAYGLFDDGTLYRVDLAKGAASEVGKIKDASGKVHDIAGMPAL